MSETRSAQPATPNTDPGSEPATESVRPGRPAQRLLFRDRQLFDVSTRLGRIVETAVAVFVVMSLCTLVAETMVSPDGTAFRWLTRLDMALLAIFSVEYVLRVLTNPKPWRYVRSFYGVIDLLAVISGIVHIASLRGAKTLRILRVFRVFKLVRYSDAVERIADAFDDIKDELAIHLGATAVLTFVASYGIYEFEHETNESYGNIFECAYWAVASLTAGAEGVAPVTVAGKVLTMLLVLIGLGVVAVPSGLLASALSRQDSHAPR